MTPITNFRVDTDSGATFYAYVEAPNANAAIRCLLEAVEILNRHHGPRVTVTKVTVRKQPVHLGTPSLGLTGGWDHLKALAAIVARPAGLDDLPGAMHASREVCALWGLEGDYDRNRALVLAHITAEAAWAKEGGRA